MIIPEEIRKQAEASNREVGVGTGQSRFRITPVERKAVSCCKAKRQPRETGEQSPKAKG